MDGLLTPILAGVIVAVVAAILGFYFNRAQENRKRQEQSQEALDVSRAKAFAEISRQARSIVAAVKTYADYMEAYIELAERTERHYKYNFYTAYEPEIEILKLMKAFNQHNDVLIDKLSSLRDYFKKERPYLDSTSRNIFRSFDEAFTGVGMDLEARIEPETLRKIDEAHQPGDLTTQEIQDKIDSLSAATASRQGLVPWNIHKLAIARREKRAFAERWRNQVMVAIPIFKQTLEAIRKTDFQSHLAALETEAERLARRAKR